MHQSFAYAATLLSLTSTAFAAGTARVVNNCGSDTKVFYASVAQNVHANMAPLPADGFSQPYSQQNDGISIKLSTSASGPVTQFEFTWSGSSIFYDISNINGNPFAQQGMSLVPSKAGAAGFPTCVVVDCPAGQSSCSAAYNQPDDLRTTVCPDDSDLTFTLCPGGSGGAPSPSENPSPSSQAPSVSQPGKTSQPAVPSIPAGPSSPIASQPSSPAETPASSSAGTGYVPHVSGSQVYAPAPAPTASAATISQAPEVTQAPSSQPQYTRTWSWGQYNHHWTARHAHRYDRSLHFHRR